jgi:NADH-quinone oxidoreductase subunit H
LDTGLHAGWVAVIVAFIQIGVVMGKTLFFCWLFVWVRWTLPRLRYDQIMGLGWKVMLNIALVNLLITAVVVRLITGDN